MRSDLRAGGILRLVAAGSVALAALVLTAAIASAQTPETATPQTAAPSATASQPVVDSRFDSPRSTMFTFLEAMDQGKVDRAVEALDIPPAERDSGREVASQLLAVLNRAGVVFRSELPDRAQVQRDAISSFVYFPRDIPRHLEMARNAPGAEIALARTASGEWKFSATTVATITELWRKTGSFTPIVRTGSRTLAMRLRSVMPAPLLREVALGVESWQWIGMALLVFLAIVIDFTVRFVARGMAVRWAKRRGGQAEHETLNRLARPVGLFAAALFGLAAVWALGLPPTALAAILVAIRLILMISGVWVAFGVTDLVSEVLASKAAQTHTRFDDLLVPLVRKSAKVLIFVTGLVYIANSLHIEILPLLTGLGIGGLAVAFAAKDTIENFFGSIAVIVDRPFEVGDWVVIDDIEGTVEELGFRSTRIRTFYNSQVTVPNALLVRTAVDNQGRRKYRRFKTTIGVAYDTDPDAIEAFCAGVRELIRQHPFTRKDYYHIWLNNFGASGLDILVYMFFVTPDWATELRERHRFMLDVLRLAHQLHVEIAFPTRTVYLRNEEIPQAPDAPAGESRALRAGARAARSIVKQAPWRACAPGPVLFEGEAIDEAEEQDQDSQVESRAGGGE